MTFANSTTRFLVESAEGTEVRPVAPAQQVKTALGSLVGSRIGTYTVTKLLGSGGVGEVFKAVDDVHKREVAIKVLRPEFASDPHFLARFNREAQINARLNHPNVARVHAFAQEGDMQYMVMEYVQGVSLDEFVRAGGPVRIERALRIFRRALDGIAHAHACGVVHRDIKPANIMLADNGTVKVMDFGIARALDCSEHLTRVGHVAGTAKALAPEQIRGGQADVRSDIYSLGLVLYTLLAGRAPFDGDNDHALMKAQLEQAPPPLHTLVRNLPPSVSAAVMRALEKDPAARFQTVREFAHALDACLCELDPMTAAAASGATTSHQTQAQGQTLSRTTVNPAIGRARQLQEELASAAALDAQMPLSPPTQKSSRHLRWAALLALPAVVAGAAFMIWPRVAHRDVATAAATPTKIAPRLPTSPAQEWAPAPTLQPLVQPLPLHSLAITRVPSGSGEESRYSAGERVGLLITASQDSHVYCYLQDETKSIRRFYPNRFEKDARVSAAAPLAIPGRMRFEIVANDRHVAETVACFATQRDVMAELPADVVGTDFAKLPVSSLDEVQNAFARIEGNALAQARFQVLTKE